MTTKKLRFPFLLLALWLIAATIIPQSYAAGGMHCVEVNVGAGCTSDAVGINVWEAGRVRDIIFAPLDGYRITAVHASYDGALADAAVNAEELPAQLTVGGTIAFPDVAAAGETHDAVATGLLHGWIDGYPDGTFRPDASIRRAEAARLINRITGRSLRVQDITTRFTDVPAAHWAFWEIISAANHAE